MPDSELIRVRLEISPELERGEQKRGGESSNLNPAQRAASESPMDRPASTSLTPSQRAASPAMWDGVRQSMRRRTTFNTRVEYAKAGAEEAQKAAPPGATKDVESRLGMIGNKLMSKSGNGLGGRAASAIRAGAAMIGPGASKMASQAIGSAAPIGAAFQVIKGGVEFISGNYSNVLAAYEALTGNKLGPGKQTAEWLADIATHLLATLEQIPNAAEMAAKAQRGAWRTGGGFGRGAGGTIDASARLFTAFLQIGAQEARVRGKFNRDAGAEMTKGMVNQLMGRAGTMAPFW